jgi:catechol 2,3-dioxygenase-like lactoylglutathione lyase family enzyme
MSPTGIIETALYVEDLPRAVTFYKTLFDLETLSSDDRFHAFSVADRHVLLLFRRGASLQPISLPGGSIPPHDGSGPVHIGFSIPAESIAEWEARLAQHGVKIESKAVWPRGGTSLYFRDPDGHLLELLTPGVWTIY